MPPLGGGERQVALLGTNQAMNLTWTPDGRRLVVSVAEAGKAFGLFVVSADSGEKRRLTSGKGVGDTVAAISPDSRTVAFGRLVNGTVATGATGELYTLALTPDFQPAGELKRLPSSGGRIPGLAWTGDGREIVISSEQNGSIALWRIAASGSGKPVRLTVGANARSLAISPRSNRLVYEVRIPSDVNIWRLDLSDAARPPTVFIASTRLEASPQYSPDGRKIAFRSSRSGGDEIWVCDADGTNATQLTNRNPSGSPQWSPDGRRIAFDSQENSTWQIFMIAAQGGQQQQLTFDGSNTRPNWSRDGAWIYFASNRSGRSEVWRAPAGGGNAVQITRTGGNNPAESEDDKILYYDFENAIRKAGLDGSGEIRVMDGVISSYGAWSVRPDGIFYRALKPSTEIRFFQFASGTSRLVLKSDTLTSSHTISPDGRYLLYSQIDGLPGSDLMLVENFH
ncbi:MAG: hypothetical protein SGI92_04135 [Bryobacteraceae bacterium]|nr:hypothetical protein [Bryobacteraceae bacterium]